MILLVKVFFCSDEDACTIDTLFRKRKIQYIRVRNYLHRTRKKSHTNAPAEIIGERLACFLLALLTLNSMPEKRAPVKNAPPMLFMMPYSEQQTWGQPRIKTGLHSIPFKV